LFHRMVWNGVQSVSNPAAKPETGKVAGRPRTKGSGL
jgi:hypothetical protein